MSIIIEKYKELESKLGSYLEDLNKNPPLGFGSFLKPLNQSFQMCRVLGQQMQAQHKRITELENEIQALKFAKVCELEAIALDAVAQAEAANDA